MFFYATTVYLYLCVFFNPYLIYMLLLLLCEISRLSYIVNQTKIQTQNYTKNIDKQIIIKLKDFLIASILKDRNQEN